MVESLDVQASLKGLPAASVQAAITRVAEVDDKEEWRNEREGLSLESERERKNRRLRLTTQCLITRENGVKCREGYA